MFLILKKYPVNMPLETVVLIQFFSILVKTDTTLSSPSVMFFLPHSDK